MTTYFTDSGEYGDATGLIRIKTDKWTEEEWNEIRTAPFALRKLLAMNIEQRHIHGIVNKAVFKATKSFGEMNNAMVKIVRDADRRKYDRLGAPK